MAMCLLKYIFKSVGSLSRLIRTNSQRRKRSTKPERRSVRDRTYARKLKRNFKRGKRLRKRMYASRRSDDVVNAIEEPEQRAKKSKRDKECSDEADQSTTEPAWKVELKEFMKDLISRVSSARLDRYARPVVRAMETKYHVNVADIDVDPFGHILIDYTDLSNPKFRNRIIIDKGKRIIRDENAKKAKNSKSKSKNHKRGKKSKPHKGFDEWSPDNYK